MSVDPRTIGWLSRALTHEMSAVQQYLAQSVLAHLGGDATLATYLRAEAVEELGHAERLMERLIRVGVAPAATNLAPARLGRSVDDLLAANRILEADAVKVYREAVAHARRMRDAESAQLFEEILEDELAHVQEIDRMMAARNGHG